MLRTGINFNEGKMHGLPGEGCLKKHRPGYSPVFLQIVEQRIDVQMENERRKGVFSPVFKTFVGGFKGKGRKCNCSSPAKKGKNPEKGLGPDRRALSFSGKTLRFQNTPDTGKKFL